MTAPAVVSAVGAARADRARPPARRSRAGGVANTGAAFILGLLVWGWVVMPLIRTGPAGVRDTLRAKFFNKNPQGEWLP